MARDRMRDEDVDTSLADRFGIPRTFKKAEAGPHVIVTAGNNPFLGLKYRAIRDGGDIGCLIKIDSRRRTATIFGMPLTWVSHMESLGYDFNLSDEEIERIDKETRHIDGVAEHMEKVGVIPLGDASDILLPKSRVLGLNGVEVDFAGMEYEMPYDAVIVELEDPNNPGPWLKYKDQLPRHWQRRYS